MKLSKRSAVALVAAVLAVGIISAWLAQRRSPGDSETAADRRSADQKAADAGKPLPADSQTPAAGICADIGEEDTVTVTVRSDVPEPRCQRIAADQRLTVRNGTAQPVSVWFGPGGGSVPSIPPGGEYYFPDAAGEFLAAGVHILHGAPFAGPEIWFDPSWQVRPRAFRFQDFPGEPAFTGTPAPVDFSTKPEARTFVSRITEGAKTGPNFNGHYTVIEWGCGTSCQTHAIVDASTGAIVEYGLESALGVDYQLASRLLVVNPPERLSETAPEPVDIITSYFEMRDGALRTLSDRQP